MDNTAEPFRPSSSASSQPSFDRPSSQMSGHFNPGSNLSIRAPSNAGAGASVSVRSNGLPSPSSDLRHLDPSPQQYNQPLSPSYSEQQYQYQQQEQYQPHQQQGGEQRPSSSTSGEIAGGDHRAEHSSQQSSGQERERAQPSYHPDHYPGRQDDRYDDRADQQQQHRQPSPHPPHALHIEPPSPRSSFPSALSSAPSPAPSSATTQSSNFSVQTNPFETAPPPSSLSSGYPPASKPFSPPSSQSSLPSAAQSAFHSVHSIQQQQHQHHQQQQQQQQQRPSSTGPQLPEQVPFTPQPGFPAVPTLGGYPTGHGNDSASGSAGQLRAPAQTPLGGEKRSIWLGDLETWMNEAYLRQMCSLMGWDIVSIKLIRPNPPPAGSNAPQNNPYCFLTFPTHHLASRILHTLTPTPTNPPIFMPSSSRPFKANWAASSTSSSNPEAVNPAFLSQDLPPEKEFSIFVGDLAPEVGEGDLVNLFLRPPPTSNGVERKGYESTRSAKIMLDAGGGGSRGYGFVRFGEEADQLRALAEMQGVYCLSRPMRLSHATAKNKAGMASHSAGGSSIGNNSSRGGTPLNAQFGGGQQHPHDIARSNSPLFPVVNPNTGLQNPRPLSYGSSQQQQQSTKALPPPTRRLSPNTIEYLSELAAANGGTLPFGPGGQIAFPPLEVKVGEQEQSSYRSSGGNVPSSLHIPSSNYNSSRSSTHDINPSPRDQQYGSYGQSPLSAVSSFPNSASPYPSSYQDLHSSLSPTSLGHASLYDPHASSMSGSGSGSGSRGGGGGVNSTDPNNTTVFVGGLSSLISEDTLKTFFTPFGEITYVKIPPGKGCGFVQFVRKVDAERAIERMQGFPIGGGRIRLSWGRSQYKAAQAAAQAAQLGVGIGALTNTIPGLSATQIGQLALALQGLSGGNLLSQLTGGHGMSNGLGGGGGSHGDGLGGLDTQNLQALLGLGGGGISGGGANGGATLDPALISRLTAQAGLSGFPADVSPPQQHSQQQQQQQQQSQHQHRDVPSAPDPHRSYSQPSLNGPSTFAPFSPAQSPNSKTSNNNLPRHGSSLLDRRHTQVDFGGLRGNGEFGSFGGGSGSYGADEEDEEDERSNAFDTLQIHQQLPRRGSQQLQHSHSSSFGAIERDSYLASVYAEGGPKTSPLHIGRSIPGSFSSYSQPPPSHLRGSFEADDDLNNNNSYLSSSRSPPRILESGSRASRHAPHSNSNSYLSSSHQEKYLQHHTPPALQQTSSYSSDMSNSNSGSYNARFLGTGGGGGGSFEPPATAPMMQNSQTDYLQQQQSQGLSSSSGRARAASASIHRSPAGAGGPPGVLDLAMEMEGLDVNGNERYNPSSSPVDETYDRMPMSAVEPRGGSFGASYGFPGGGERRSIGGMGGGGGERASGRSFGFGSFGGVLPSSAGLRSNFPNSRLGSGGRLGDE